MKAVGHGLAVARLVKRKLRKTVPRLSNRLDQQRRAQSCAALTSTDIDTRSRHTELTCAAYAGRVSVTCREVSRVVLGVLATSTGRAEAAGGKAGRQPFRPRRTSFYPLPSREDFLSTSGICSASSRDPESSRARMARATVTALVWFSS